MQRNEAEGLLLSGGLETSILAYLASRRGKPSCYTVALEGAPAPDVPYALRIAELFQLPHKVHTFGFKELEEALREVVKVMRSFDPMEIRNSASIYIALRVAKTGGMKRVMTGDAGDELFAGYNFFFDKDKPHLDEALNKMWENMTFSSIPLAQSLGMEARLPFMDGAFKSFAMALDSSLKVRQVGDKVWGKWILRRAFEPFLPKEAIWRVKTPIEYGSGTTTLPAYFSSQIPDSYFEGKKRLYISTDGVALRDKEQLHYYEIYRSLFGPPLQGGDGEKHCPECRVAVPGKVSFCRTCGAYPV